MFLSEINIIIECRLMLDLYWSLMDLQDRDRISGPSMKTNRQAEMAIQGRSYNPSQNLQP